HGLQSDRAHAVRRHLRPGRRPEGLDARDRRDDGRHPRQPREHFRLPLRRRGGDDHDALHVGRRRGRGLKRPHHRLADRRLRARRAEPQPRDRGLRRDHLRDLRRDGRLRLGRPRAQLRHRRGGEPGRRRRARVHDAAGAGPGGARLELGRARGRPAGARVL
ncbi:MAG: hypothetical protein AVDCRST_MAG64-2712, partial [uncultured Phycisphaerae bacterium]